MSSEGRAEGPIVVVGLGYVGLPLAVALAKHGAVLGFDISGERIAELKRGYDRTAEVLAEALSAGDLTLTDDPTEIDGGSGPTTGRTCQPFSPRATPLAAR
jgi:UDP-N-acetyl-D-mannosaminuronate dehydrogenase